MNLLRNYVFMVLYYKGALLVISRASLFHSICSEYFFYRTLLDKIPHPLYDTYADMPRIKKGNARNITPCIPIPVFCRKPILILSQIRLEQLATRILS